MNRLITLKIFPELKTLEAHLKANIFSDARQLYPYSREYSIYFDRTNALLVKLKEIEGALFDGIEVVPVPKPVKVDEYDSTKYIEKESFRPLIENVDRCLAIISASRTNDSVDGIGESNRPYVFISYHNSEKQIAGQVKEVLDGFGIESFLAHDDITVSEEWADKILEEIRKAKLFVCLLSRKYKESAWCMQESGMAALLKSVAILPFSLDGTIPEGCISKYQAVKIRERFFDKDIVPGLIKYDFNLGIALAIKVISESGSFRGAESNFELIYPYYGRLSLEQGKSLLLASCANSQVHNAALCGRKYLPPILKKYGHLISEDDQIFLRGAIGE